VTNLSQRSGAHKIAKDSEGALNPKLLFQTIKTDVGKSYTFNLLSFSASPRNNGRRDWERGTLPPVIHRTRSLPSLKNEKAHPKPQEAPPRDVQKPKWRVRTIIFTNIVTEKDSPIELYLEVIELKARVSETRIMSH
jgi:hypothetical protein